jgi:hypothetical protein
MVETTRIEGKVPEARKEKVDSQKHKTDFPQSIGSPVDQMLFLQRTIGNHAVGRIIRSGSLQAPEVVNLGRVQREPDQHPAPEDTLNAPMTDSEWQNLDSWQNRGGVGIHPLTKDADHNADLVAMEIFCNRRFPLHDPGDPLLCIIPEVTRADPRVQKLKKQVVSKGPIMTNWEAKARAASQAMDDAGHKQGPPIIGTGAAPVASGNIPQWFIDLQNKLSVTRVWTEKEENAQNVLRDWYIEQAGGKLPANVRILLDFIGRSVINNAEAIKANFKGTSHFGGEILPSGRYAPDWCTRTTTKGMEDALREMGYKPSGGPLDFISAVSAAQVGGKKLKIYGEAAYTEPLMPGDYIMYLFDSCQHGGHTVTVIEERDNSFTHVSGNTVGAAVRISESKRLKQPPIPRGKNPTFDIDKCNPGKKELFDTATEFIKTFDFQRASLVYSITRYGGVFDELEALNSIKDPVVRDAKEQEFLTRFHLRKVTDTPGIT